MSAQFRVLVTYQDPLSKHKTQQTYNADRVQDAIAIAQREIGKPRVVRCEILATIEVWDKHTH